MNQFNYSTSITGIRNLELVQNPSSPLLVDDLMRFQHYIQEKVSFAASTKRIHVSRIRQLIRFLKNTSPDLTIESYPAAVTEFINFAMENLGLRASSINNFQKTFRLYGNFANIQITRRRIAPEKILRKRLTGEEEARLLETAGSANSCRNRILFLLFLRTDLRLHECVNLELRQLYLDDRVPNISVMRQGKQTQIVMGQDVVDAMENWLAERALSSSARNSTYVFFGPGGKNLTTSAIDSCVRKVGWRAHLDVSVRVLSYTGRTKRMYVGAI